MLLGVKILQNCPYPPTARGVRYDLCQITLASCLLVVGPTSVWTTVWKLIREYVHLSVRPSASILASKSRAAAMTRCRVAPPSECN